MNKVCCNAPLCGKATRAKDGLCPAHRGYTSPVSYRADMCVSGAWCSNSLRFVTREAAEVHARDLFSRWTQPSDWRVEECSDAPTLDASTVVECERIAAHVRVTGYSDCLCYAARYGAHCPCEASK